MITGEQELPRFGKGIGNAVRFKIAGALASGPKTVHELTDIVGLSQSAVSQHLSKMKRCGVLLDERRGQEVYYRLNRHHLAVVVASLLKLVGNESTDKSYQA